MKPPRANAPASEHKKYAKWFLKKEEHKQPKNPDKLNWVTDRPPNEVDA